MQRRLKIAFHVEDMDKPSGSRIIIAPMQVIVTFDGSSLDRPSQASEELDGAGAVIGRFVLLTLAGRAPLPHGADAGAVVAAVDAAAGNDRSASEQAHEASFMDREGAPKDVCDCGDYREQHDEHGRCRFNKPGGIGHAGTSDCPGFRLFARAGSATHVGALSRPVPGTRGDGT